MHDIAFSGINVQGESKTLVRIGKKQARKLYNTGKTVYLAACNANLKSRWIHPFMINSTNVDCDGQSFDSVVNAFEYYNCNSELGKYAAYYVEQ